MFKKSLTRKFSFTIPAPRKLREIMKLSVVQKEPKDIIIDIWNKYHKDKQFNVAKVFI